MCDSFSMWWWITVLYRHMCISNEVQLSNMADKSVCPTLTLYHQRPFLERTSFLLRGVVETRMEKEWGRGGRKKKKREMEMFSLDLGRSLNLLFASLLWLTLLRPSTQIAHLAYFVFLNIICKKGHYTYWKCDIRDGALKNIKNSYPPYPNPCMDSPAQKNPYCCWSLFCNIILCICLILVWINIHNNIYNLPESLK